MGISSIFVYPLRGACLLVLNLLIGALIAYSVRFPKYLRFLLQNRRWLGVMTFSYLSFHLMLYLTMEVFETQAFTQMATKLYLTLGVSAFSIMAVLALTSNDFSLRKLDFKRWKNLHRLVHLTLCLITVHVMMIKKADLIFCGIFFAGLWLTEPPRLLRLKAKRLP